MSYLSDILPSKSAYESFDNWEYTIREFLAALDTANIEDDCIFNINETISDYGSAIMRFLENILARDELSLPALWTCLRYCMDNLSLYDLCHILVEVGVIYERTIDELMSEAIYYFICAEYNRRSGDNDERISVMKDILSRYRDKESVYGPEAIWDADLLIESAEKRNISDDVMMMLGDSC